MKAGNKTTGEITWFGEEIYLSVTREFGALYGDNAVFRGVLDNYQFEILYRRDEMGKNEEGVLDNS